MSNELSVTYVGSDDVYCIIRRMSDSKVWDNVAEAWDTWANADIADYDIPLTDVGGDVYSEDAPSDLVNGTEYRFNYYEMAGVSPTVTDLLIGSEEGNWNGTTLEEEGTTPAAAGQTQATGLTFYDLIEDLEDFATGHSVGVAARSLRAAVLGAYEELVQAHDWSFMHTSGRLQAYAAQSDGTIDYDHDTLTMTLTDETFPLAWTAGAAITLNGVTCDVDRRLTSTTATLDATNNPGEDLTEESYVLFQRRIALPANFLSMDAPMTELYGVFGARQGLPEQQAYHRWYQDTGDMRHWDIGVGADGGLSFYFTPAMDEDYLVDYVYKKRARDMKLTGMASGHSVGTISVSGTAVTGSGTSFSSSMVGSVIRISDSTDKPTGIEGEFPYLEEKVIRAVGSTTSITLESSGTSAAGVAYRVSDQCDLPRILHDAMRKCCRKHLAQGRSFKGSEMAANQYREALVYAKRASSMSTATTVAMGARRRHVRLADRDTS